MTISERAREILCHLPSEVRFESASHLVVVVQSLLREALTEALEDVEAYAATLARDGFPKSADAVHAASHLIRARMKE